MRLVKTFLRYRTPLRCEHRNFSALIGLISTLIFLSPAIAGTHSPGALSVSAVNSPMDSEEITKLLADNFNQLPERQIANNKTRTVFALYAQATSRYDHNILGDSIEAERLIVIRDGVLYTHTPGEQYIYEDIMPRLFDVDNDGQMEVVTIRTHVTKGAGIMIYKISNGSLSEFAWVEEIGIPYRWLNIAAIYDLDGDGIIELAWIQTPHIGGILKVARIKAGKLTAFSEIFGYSNHGIGERNLCLSVVTNAYSDTRLYLPTQDRHKIAGFKITGRTIKQTESIEQSVDFSYSLQSQYDFSNVVQGEDLCSALLFPE